jgi:hypothetical protein
MAIDDDDDDDDNSGDDDDDDCTTNALMTGGDGCWELDKMFWGANGSISVSTVDEDDRSSDPSVAGKRQWIE